MHRGQPGIASGVPPTSASRVLILASDWRWQRSPGRFDFGAEYRHSSGHFRYDDDVQFDMLFDVPGAPTEPSRTRSLRADLTGDHYAATRRQPRE
jgi:hypothetical protein